MAVYGVGGDRRRWQVEVASEGATGRRGAAVSQQLRAKALALREATMNRRADG